MNQKIITSVLIFFLNALLAISVILIVYNSNLVPAQELVEHEPILIYQNSDFEAYDFPGKGTIDQPYLIQNLNITTTYSQSIYISGTTKYFVIRDCFLKSSYINILIDHAEGSNKIVGNEIIGAQLGLRISYSPNIIIENNIISIEPYYENGETLYNYNTDIYSCENAIIRRNYFFHGEFVICGESNNVVIKENEFYISIFRNPMHANIGGDSSNVTISYNFFAFGNRWIVDGSNSTIYRNMFEPDGILTVFGHNTTVTENSMKEGGMLEVHGSNAKVIGNKIDQRGILEVNSTNSLVMNNQVGSGGFGIYKASTIFENNLINNQEIGFFVNLNNQVYSNDIYAQYIFIECENLTIQDLQVENTLYGILVVSSNNITILGNSLRDNIGDGINVLLSHNIVVEDNYLENGGIIIGASSNAVIRKNNGFNSPIAAENSSFILIENNTVANPGGGGSFWQRGNRSLGILTFKSNNILVRNNVLDYSRVGIFCSGTKDSSFFNNSCSFGEYGIFVTYYFNRKTFNNTFVFNLMKMNTNVGLYLGEGTANITIHHNAFIDNYEFLDSQAIDHGDNNIWFDINTLAGNFWSNWGGIDPYWIAGGNYDLFPLAINPL